MPSIEKTDKQKSSLKENKIASQKELEKIRQESLKKLENPVIYDVFKRLRNK